MRNQNSITSSIWHGSLSTLMLLANSITRWSAATFFLNCSATPSIVNEETFSTCVYFFSVLITDLFFNNQIFVNLSINYRSPQLRTARLYMHPDIISINNIRIREQWGSKISSLFGISLEYNFSLTQTIKLSESMHQKDKPVIESNSQ